MRHNMKKYLFIGFKDEKEAFFKEAQKLGVLEFKNPQGLRHIPLSKEAEAFDSAIKILRSYVLREQEIRHDVKLAYTVRSDILETKRLLDNTQEKLLALTTEKELIAPFGDFTLQATGIIESNSRRKIRFYSGKSSRKLEDIDENLVLIRAEQGIDYFITFCEMHLRHPDLMEVHIQEPLYKIKKEIAECEKLIAQHEGHLKDLTRYNWLLHWTLIQELNKTDLSFAINSASATLEATLFVVEGWIPENKIDELKKLLKENSVTAQEIAKEGEETPPTYLENSGTARIGEDLIEVFDTPSHEDKDPSLWVLVFFSLFFAIIIGDAGYGLVFLFTALLIKLKIKTLKGLAKRMVLLLAILGGASVGWGLLTSSFFGIELSPDNPLKKCSLTTWLVEKKASYHLAKKDAVYQFWVKKIPAIEQCTTGKELIKEGNASKLTETPEVVFNRDVMMELALMIGAIHVILGLARYLGKRPVGAGWIAFIVGGYLFLPQIVHATSILHFVFGLAPEKAANFGFQLLVGGISYSLITSILLSGAIGIFDTFMASVGIFSDILSYLRLYALGLSGAILSQLIGQMVDTLPLFIGILAAILAHATNLILCIMGGVIHGLRLNFLEWYHYSFDGGGRLFKPLQLHHFE